MVLNINNFLQISPLARNHCIMRKTIPPFDFDQHHPDFLEAFPHLRFSASLIIIKEIFTANRLFTEPTRLLPRPVQTELLPLVFIHFCKLPGVLPSILFMCYDLSLTLLLPDAALARLIKPTRISNLAIKADHLRGASGV